jgi:hypothetical protein
VGLDESEAARQQIPVRVAKLPMRSALRRQATDQTTGFMKVLIAADSDLIVGFSMVGAQAGEVMAAVQTAMFAKLPFPHLRDAVIAHLTYAEGLGPLLSNVPPPAAGWRTTPNRSTKQTASRAAVDNLVLTRRVAPHQSLQRGGLIGSVMINVQIRMATQAIDHEVDESLKSCAFLCSLQCPIRHVAFLPVFVSEGVADQIFKPTLADEWVAFRIEKYVSWAGLT